jgi:hypothetical protein
VFGHVALEIGCAFGSEGWDEAGFGFARLRVAGEDDQAICQHGGFLK